MLPDITFPAGTWADLYQLSGLPVGTPLLVTNKNAGHQVFVWEGAASPPPNATYGYPLDGHKTARVSNGAAGCWVFSMASVGPAMGRILVQEWQA